MLSETEQLIKRLNTQGLLVSVDYEPNGTFSASILQNTDAGWWEPVWMESNIIDLYTALRSGEKKAVQI